MTPLDLVTVFWQTKCVTKSGVHCTCCEEKATKFLSVNGPISWTCRTQNISKNQNIYPHQSRITFQSLLWDTLYINCNSVIFFNCEMLDYANLGWAASKYLVSFRNFIKFKIISYIDILWSNSKEKGFLKIKIGFQQKFDSFL